MDELLLARGFVFEDLYDRNGLLRLDAGFQESLTEADGDLAVRLTAARNDPDSLELKAESALLIELAPHLEDFLAELFGIEAELAALAAEHNALAPLYQCKRLFVQRRAGKALKPDEAMAVDGEALAESLTALGAPPDDELAFARQVQAWSEDEEANAEPLETALHYAAWALHSPAGQARHAAGVLFKQPHKVDPLHLVPLEEENCHGTTASRLSESRMRRREGFDLTDDGMELVAALDHAHYCIFCHNQGKDSCSRGLRERTKEGPGGFKASPFGVPLAGCPLEEKISEMHVLKTAGQPLGALAVAVVDNPMLAGTGHRICNDCMKACIYQKQDPVDIPQVETRALKDILELPWGFEVYSLLTRWNPLNLRRPLPLADSGKKVLIAGLGPAGSTLAHYLLNDGHAVFAIDGLKIEPLAPELSGVDAHGGRLPFRPIRDLESLREPLGDRVMAGFGGVAEYGITVRWDKTFLKVLRLLLERRAGFAMCGGVRLGGTLTLDQAFEIGFDHVALALGAGKPTILDLPNGIAPGVRMASDFLMALQLTGAAKTDSIANLQIRLPAVVIGGGLTAIDTATEVLAYYPVQVEKFLARYEVLVAERGEAAVRARFLPGDLAIADEFLGHARAIRAERAAAAEEDRPPRLRELLERWGGATIAYRRRLIDSPSYTLNHEEVGKALEEGVRFAEGLTPLAVEVDDEGKASAVRFARKRPGEDGETEVSEVTLPARALLVAAGTRPNTVLAREDARNLSIEGRYFQAYDEAGAPVTPEASTKPEAVRVLASLQGDGRAVSFFGDLHPSYAGNVVKAMASAKQGWPVVSRMLAGLERPASDTPAADFTAALTADLRPTVEAVNRLTPTIVEVVVRAPAAARAFRPGQFYRLQNFETLAPKVEGTRLAMEGLAMTGAWTDLERGLIGTIMLEMGGSSDLGPLLKPGDPVILMGPTGAPTEIPADETVLLAGGGLGNAVLFSIGRAMREAGSRVIYFAGYKAVRDRYKVEEIEAAADQVVWACDEAPGFEPSREGDLTYVGNIVDAMVAYQNGALGARRIELTDVDRIIAIGSDRMMAAVEQARTGALGAWLKPGHIGIGSINSPMQCMMKEICAQCVQPHRDPETGEVSVVFSCFNQDQPLERVDFQALHERLGQNGAQERLTAQWIDRCLKEIGVRAVA